MYKVRAMSTAPLRAYEGSTDKPDVLPPDDPLSLLVTRPNKHQSFTEFHGQNVVYLNISGNCYILFDRAKPQELPSAMYSLRPDRVVIVPVTERGGTASVGYVYVPEGASAWGSWDFSKRVTALRRDNNPAFVIPPDCLMHVKFPNPADPLEGMGYGLSPIAPAARSADVDNKITEFLKLFFDQGTMTYGLLKLDVPLDDTAIASIKERWREIYGGYKNWEDIAILDRGAEYQRIGFTFDEMGFDSLDERNETRVVGPLGVPGILIGTRIGLTRATYSNVVELRKMFWEDTMVPETTLFETEFKYYLTQPDSDAFVAFDYSKVPALQGVRTERQQQVQAAYSAGAATRNEYRAALNLPLDERKGSYYVMPIGLVEVPSGFTPKPAVTALPAEAAPPATPAAQAEDDEEGAAAAVEDEEQRDEEAPKSANLTDEQHKDNIVDVDGFITAQIAKAQGDAAPQSRLSQEAKAAHWKAVDRIARSWEGKFEAGAVDAFEADKRALLAILSKGKSDAYAGKRTVSWGTIQSDAKKYLRGPSREQWTEKFRPLIAGLMEDQVAHVEETFFGGGKAGDGPVEKKQITAAQWFLEYTLQFSQPICATTERNIAALLAQAQDEGWSIPTTMQHLETVFERYVEEGVPAEDLAFFAERAPAYRRENIARSETIRSSNAAATATYEAWNVEAREWLATLDGRGRPAHMAANGQIRPMGEPFNVGGEELMYPGDPEGSPENTCECRCGVAPVL
jgi:HK97 family phage portal protein